MLVLKIKARDRGFKPSRGTASTIADLSADRIDTINGVDSDEKEGNAKPVTNLLILTLTGRGWPASGKAHPGYLKNKGRISQH